MKSPHPFGCGLFTWSGPLVPIPVPRAAKERRQIVIVTHNANLVVNADANQVIVATAGEHQPGQLPEIRYEAGGLENPYIRGKVCWIKVC